MDGFVATIAHMGDGWLRWDLHAPVLPALASRRNQCVTLTELAVSQADDVVLGSDLVKQGLLSFALVQNGLEGRQADFKSKELNRWLNSKVHMYCRCSTKLAKGWRPDLGRQGVRGQWNSAAKRAMRIGGHPPVERPPR